MRDRVLPLPDAAMRLKAPYPVAMRLLLTGRLEGERRGSRWFVTAESVQRELDRRADEDLPAGSAA